MIFNDNRQFIEALAKTGDVLSIKEEVDWDLEAGAITRRANELQGPAVLFDKVKDYPEGYRIFGSPMGTYRRVAVAMGLPVDSHVGAIYAEYERRQDKLIKPKVVKNAPCKENVLTGDDIDLYRFPSPMIHDGDGGRYIGSWDIVVSQDPDTGWINWGMYRFMVHNSKFLIGLPLPQSHLKLVFNEKYAPVKRPMPVAVIIGGDPLSSLAAASARPSSESEADFAGALRQEPVEVVKCETNDLLVPAHAEIVIEGDILPGLTAPEGPFGEYPGYRTQEVQTGLLLRVAAITWRNAPIMTMTCLGVPFDDMSTAGAMGMAIAMKTRLRMKGIPVVDLYVPPEGASHLVVVSVKSGGIETATKIRDLIAKRRAFATKIIVVDEDVDVFNMTQVLHAFSTKCHSLKGIASMEQKGTGSPLTPCYSREERRRGDGAVAVFDATWPVEWPKEDIPFKSSFDAIYPEAVKRKVLAKWAKYGF